MGKSRLGETPKIMQLTRNSHKQPARLLATQCDTQLACTHFWH